MKLLQINVVYKTGSTGKIVESLNRGLTENGYEVSVCYSRGEKFADKNLFRACGTVYSRFNKVISKISGIAYGGCFFSTMKVISFIKKQNPDIVHLHCLNGNFINVYKILNFLKRDKIKTVLTLHAELMFTGGCGYTLGCDKWKTGCADCTVWKRETGSLFFNRTAKMFSLMQDAFSGYDNLIIVACSDWLANLARQSVMFSDKKIVTVHNGINTDAYFRHENADEIKRTYGIPQDKKIVLSVNPRFSDTVKGGDLFLELAKKLPLSYLPVIVGTDKKIDGVLTFPYISGIEEMSKLYSIADCFVITSRTDNYPTVCLEANCCGTPVVGFDVGGVKETIGTGMGETVNSFDVSTLCEKIIFWCKNKEKISKETVAMRREYNNEKRMVQDYLTLYGDLLNNNE